MSRTARWQAWVAEFGDPGADAKRAATAGDFRFCAVNDGGARRIPYIDEEYPELSRSSVARDLAPWDEGRTAYEAERSKLVLMLYAQDYNRLLLEERTDWPTSHKDVSP